jgi:hypothetical protein
MKQEAPQQRHSRHGNPRTFSPRSTSKARPFRRVDALFALLSMSSRDDRGLFGMTVTQRNLDGYGTPPIEWERVRDLLASDITKVPGTGGPDRHTPWLTTINPDGLPPVTPVGFVQVDGAWYFNWHVYRITPARVFAFGTAEPYGATRFDLTR